MKRYSDNGLLFFMATMIALAVLISCGTSGSVGVKTGSGNDAVIQQPPVAKKGPPPWAPAHGHRKKYQYRYYPDSSIYHDTGRSLYFYIESDNWTVAASLPSRLYEHLGGYVVVDMTTDKPYTYHSEHKKKYPPGQAKKNRSDKWAYKEKK